MTSGLISIEKNLYYIDDLPNGTQIVLTSHPTKPKTSWLYCNFHHWLKCNLRSTIKILTDRLFSNQTPSWRGFEASQESSAQHKIWFPLIAALASGALLFVNPLGPFQIVENTLWMNIQCKRKLNFIAFLMTTNNKTFPIFVYRGVVCEPLQVQPSS